METSNYVLETNYIQWDANSLIEYVTSDPVKDSWKDTHMVMPFIKLTGREPVVFDILRKMSEDFEISPDELYIVKLKANSVLGRHRDTPRKVSFNFPLIGDFDSSFVKFYLVDYMPPEPPRETITNPHNMKKDMITLYRVETDHSFHNPTNNDIIILNLSVRNDWETTKNIIESKL